jgi:hypothetical protein
VRLHLPRKLTASVVVAAILIVAAPVAFAGSNGQQLVIYAGSATNSVKISGDNQAGNKVAQTLNTPSYPTQDPGHWWKGTVEITSYTGTDGTGTDEGTLDCDVPVSQSSNWYDCSAY